MDQRIALARDFELESHRIDQLIWDTMALRSGESVLFCGFGNDIEWIKRAAAVGVNVSVIASDESAIREFADLKVAVVRGSTSMIPAKDASFDAAVAFHYLHECDPFFHANVVSELARVGKRLVIVEPAPPTDPLGLRIASLYSRAKRELGQFEYYQNVDYWRKLLAIVKPDVTQQTFTFTRTPPRTAIEDTVALILDTMAVEDTPEAYLQELHALAKRPDAQLVPQARFVLVGAAAGQIPVPIAGTTFRAPAPEPPTPLAAQSVNAKAVPPAPAAPQQPQPRFYPTAAEPEMPPPPPLPAVAQTAVPAPAPGGAPGGAPSPAFPNTPSGPVPVARNAFGLGPETTTDANTPPMGFGFAAPEPAPASGVPAPFAMPFATSGDRAEAPFGIPGDSGQAGLGWAWEPPENTG